MVFKMHQSGGKFNCIQMTSFILLFQLPWPSLLVWQQEEHPGHKKLSDEVLVCSKV